MTHELRFPMTGSWPNKCPTRDPGRQAEIQDGDHGWIRSPPIGEWDQPTSTVKKYADWQKWGHDWLDDERLVVTVAGQWRTFTVVLDWARESGTLRLFCSFPIALEVSRELEIYRTANLLNQSSDSGGLTVDFAAGIVTCRRGLEIPVEGNNTMALVCVTLHEMTEFCDRCYPALDMVNLGSACPETAAAIALMEVAGTA